MSGRVQAALTINRGNLGFSSHIGGRQADPWVQANRELLSLFSRLHPPKSEGRFFQRWSMGNNEGRLQLVEWFKALLAKYQQHQIVIFDPYFEAAGLGLILLCATLKSDYIVFTSMPKIAKSGGEIPEESDSPFLGRINNLMASCEQNARLLSRIKFRVYALREGRLHDRYILVIGEDGLPVTGFHLSNSFQKAAENYPLLVTPIPSDALVLVEKYKSSLVKEAMSINVENNDLHPALQLIFDSTTPQTVLQRYEPLYFLDNIESGNVLSIWSGVFSLKGLCGEQLREGMVIENLLEGNSLKLPKEGLHNCLDKLIVTFEGFVTAWDVLGEILAHSSSAENEIYSLETNDKLIEFVKKFLERSFERIQENLDGNLAVMDLRFFG
jgi:hypothetical protein